MKNPLKISTAMFVLSAAGEGAPAAEAAPAKPAKEKQPTANGITRPTPGTKTGDVWDHADQISASKGRPALREEVMAACTEAGINKGTIATQYARWTQFYGVTKEARQVARAAEKPAVEPTPAPESVPTE